MPKVKVLFVCLGNSCRSQMAEGFARVYGREVMDVASAGLAPATSVAEQTVATMRERNVDISQHFPKSIYEVSGGPFDLVVNMSGYPMPRDVTGNFREWTVRDPIGQSPEVYRQVATQIENMVMQLVLEYRGRPAGRPGPASQLGESNASGEAPRRRHRLGDPRSR